MPTSDKEADKRDMETCLTQTNHIQTKQQCDTIRDNVSKYEGDIAEIDNLCRFN